jgi:hypothetical protein
VKEIDMFIKIGMARFGDSAYTRTAIGVVGAVLANLVLVGTVEHIIRAAALL